MPDKKTEHHEYSQKQRDQYRSRTGHLPEDEQTTLNTSEVQEGPKGSPVPDPSSESVPDYESEENEGGSTRRSA